MNCCEKALLYDGIYENVQMPNTFPFCRPSWKCSAGWIYFLRLPSCSLSLDLSTSHLLFAPPLSPGWDWGSSLLVLSATSLSSTTLVEKRMCRKPCRIALYVLYIWNKDCILFKSRLCSVSALPSCGQAQVLQAALQDNIMDTRVGKKTKHSCLFANTNGDNFQCVRPPVGCFLSSKQTINT